MKSNRDLLQELTILNTVLLLTFTEYSYSVEADVENYDKVTSSGHYVDNGCGHIGEVVRFIEKLLEITNIRDEYVTFCTTREYKLGDNQLLLG
uniref:RxLR effector candidate protein n=1 Tax=Hyaloperonospora arabidopsidis (strain Emoy2) TaxID=559515 RepID=M4C5F6_HYAAE